MTFRRSLLALVFIGLALAVWGFGIEPRLLQWREMSFASERWPKEMGSLRVAVAGDFHVGAPHMGEDMLAEIVDGINAGKPDIILLLGDYVIQGVVGGRPVPSERITKALGRLKAPLGVYSVIGNHDWWEDGERISAELEANGIRVLENASTAIDTPKGRFWLAGLADDTTRMPAHSVANDLPGAEPLILLMHDPGSFFEVNHRPMLSLAGHTHGGQVSFPFIGPLVIPGRAGPDWAYGLIEDQGRRMYVTSGIGTSILPVRFNMPPEVVFMTISSETRQ